MQPPEGEIDDEPAELCLHCGNAHQPGISQCPTCRAPLGSLATGAPWEMMRARDVAHRSQTDPKLKPIVFYGIWLYFGPTGIASAIGLLYFARGILSWGLPDAFPERVAELSLGMSIVFYFFFSTWALFAVTRRYLRKGE